MMKGLEYAIALPFYNYTVIRGNDKQLWNDDDDDDVDDDDDDDDDDATRPQVNERYVFLYFQVDEKLARLVV